MMHGACKRYEYPPEIGPLHYSILIFENNN